MNELNFDDNKKEFARILKYLRLISKDEYLIMQPHDILKILIHHLMLLYMKIQIKFLIYLSNSYLNIVFETINILNCFYINFRKKQIIISIFE